MELKRITEFDERDLRELDALMHELSANSFCTEEQLRDVVGDANSYLIVARDTASQEPFPSGGVGVGSITGCGTLCVMHTPEMRIGAIEAVVVKQDYRGRGIGKRIVEELLRIARGLAPITLHLTSSPARVAANGLYREMGFLKKETNCYVMKM